jgi:hypothetical protein
MNAFQVFCQTEVPKLAALFKEEAIEQGFTFDQNFEIREETSGTMIPFPDYCGDANLKPIPERVKQWCLVFHEELVYAWEATYEGMKAGILRTIDEIENESDREYLRKTLVCDDANETFMFKGKSKRAQEIIKKHQNK